MKFERKQESMGQKRVMVKIRVTVVSGYLRVREI